MLCYLSFILSIFFFISSFVCSHGTLFYWFFCFPPSVIHATDFSHDQVTFSLYFCKYADCKEKWGTEILKRVFEECQKSFICVCACV
jgi:hypothetical protein